MANSGFDCQACPMSECANCHRRGNDLMLRLENRSVLKKNNCKKLYYCVEEASSCTVDICAECRMYFFNDTKTKQAGHYWPGMIYCFLTLKEEPEVYQPTMAERWAMLPRSFHRWWVHLVDSEVMLLDPKFVDVTDQHKSLARALEGKQWLNLSLAMDQHMAYPEVRCPWGDSEFLHKVNLLPYGDFLWYASNYTMHYYQPQGTKYWTSGIYPTFPSSCSILENDAFQCRPSIIVTDNGPMVLSCRSHSVRSTQSYLHTPKSVTGTIYTPNSNQFAPAVMRPRTLRNMKLNLYSDTYCTAILQGGYNGFDSAFATSQGNVTKSDNLALLRDSLSIAGRDDVRAHVRSLSTNPMSSNFVPASIVDRKLKDSEIKFPDLACRPEIATATCIDLDDAITLQEKIYSETARTIEYWEDKGTSTSRQILYHPPWPEFFLFVNRLDGYGERFHRITCQDFGMFIHLGVTYCVQEIWKSISCSVVNNRQWHGHWLTFATKKLALPKLKCSNKSAYIFKEKTAHEMFSVFDVPLYDQYKSKAGTRHLFQQCHGIVLVDDIIDESTKAKIRSKGVTSVIMTFPNKQQQMDNNTASDLGLELRCVVAGVPSVPSTWRIYARHTRKHFWVQNRRGAEFAKCSSASNIYGRGIDRMVVAVYCKLINHDAHQLRRRYLNCIGGQDIVYCCDHKVPLITYHKKGEQSAKCCAPGSDTENTPCSRMPIFCCPYLQQCGVAICQKHHGAEQTSYKNDYENIVLLSRLSKTSTTLQCMRNQSKTQSKADASMFILPEALGPTAAHELPQDLYSNSGGCLSDDKSVGTCSSYMTYNNKDHGIFGHNVAKDSGSVGTMSLHSVESAKVEQNPFDGAAFTMTESGVDPLRVSVQTPYGESCSMYVLLNQQGHLLTRKRSKLRMSKTNQAFCQKIIARSASKTIPLVYPEGMLFPDIFWFNLPDGSLPGSFPSGLLADASILSSLNVAGHSDHARARINNPELLYSTDPRPQLFEFDKQVNIGLNGQDSRLCMHRGFADQQGEDGVRFRARSDSAELYGDCSENKANVYKLSALAGESMPHFFFTQSCNQSTCHGLKVLRAWVTSYEATKLIADKYQLDMEQASRYLRESAASFVLRSWNEVIDTWMMYIIHSPEEPLGKIEYAWYRKEFQEKQGNPCHIHAILKTTYNIHRRAGFDAIVGKIRGSLSDLVHQKELLELQTANIVSSTSYLEEILSDALQYLTHRCHERCQIPTSNQDGLPAYRCKVPDNFFLSSNPQAHSIQQIHVNHSPEAIQILQSLSMMDGPNIIEPSLRMERHIPKCSRHNPKFSPTNGHLYVCFPSAQNIQLCTGYSVTSYLTKYISQVDDVATLAISPQKHTDLSVAPAEMVSLHNTKITGNKVQAEIIRNKKTRNGKLNARPLCQPEYLTVLMKYNLVTSTEQFVHVPTLPREYRPALFSPRIPASRRVSDGHAPLAIVGQAIREGKRFRSHRLFTADQLTVIKDELASKLSTDAITAFSIRPPELRFVTNPRWYLKWFHRTNVTPALRSDESEIYCDEHLHSDLSKCEWLDGMNCKMTLRPGAIEAILQYAELKKPRAFGMGRQGIWAKRGMVFLLSTLSKMVRAFVFHDAKPERHKTERDRTEWMRLQRLFLVRTPSQKMPTVWWTPMYPKSRGRFLVQILLLFGDYITEYGLMKAGNMRSAYIAAGLLDECNIHVSVSKLLRRYVLECLAIQPGSTFQFDTNLCLAEHVFSQLAIAESTAESTSDTPSVLQSRMVEETTEDVSQYSKEVVSIFLQALLDDLKPCCDATILPSPSDFPIASDRSNQNCCPNKFFPPPWNPGGLQCAESYEEQHGIMELAGTIIKTYCQGLHHKNLVICGGPGNGKTTVAQFIALFALQQGLKGICTSVVADRSKQLGGIHIHVLASLKGTNVGRSPGQAAEAAIASLYRKPRLIHLWRTLDFLVIDEFGMFSAELLATVDMVARHFRKSSQFLGGLIIFASMDILQLLPFKGTPLMLSMNMMSEFLFRELNHSVRAARDPDLRALCNLTRSNEWTPQKEKQFCHIIGQKCNFVSSLNDDCIPKDAVYVFARKQPCRNAEALILMKLKRSDSGKVVTSFSYDEESTTASNWKGASSPVVDILSRTERRAKELPLYSKGRYEFTYNLDGKFQQGQLGLLLSVDEEIVKARKPITLFRAPPGCKDFPGEDDISYDKLLQSHWVEVKVPFSTSIPAAVFSGIMARRSQYGVRMRVASTIHASMGATLQTMVTCVANNPREATVDYTLWEQAQVVVLLSRTRQCKDMYFVGSPTATANALLRLLKKRNYYVDQIRSLLAKLCGNSSSPNIITAPDVFRPCDATLPNAKAVYLLVSTRNPCHMYIGESGDIRKRLRQHNSGQGTAVTNNRRLHPWAMYGFAHGTSLQNRTKRQSFETRWKLRIRNVRTKALNADDALSIGRDLAQSLSTSALSDIIIEQTGHITISR